MAKSLISSFTVALKKATTITEDVEQAKKEHRQQLKDLMDKYTEDVAQGKAEGIRTAKELVEVIKLDLLLMGEATDRTENNNPIEDAQVVKITQMMDDNNPEIQALIESMYSSLNEVNDSLDTTSPSVGEELPNREPVEEDTSSVEESITEEVHNEVEEKEEEVNE